MRRFAEVLFCLLAALLAGQRLKADSITIQTGETIVATIGLSNYESVRSSPVCTIFGPCPLFPVGVLPSVDTDDPTNPLNQYSLQAFLESTNDGQEFLIGTLPLVTVTDATTGQQSGAFEYNDLYAGYSFPSDPTFWGPDPSTDTFELIFQNTGDPFTLFYDPSLSYLTPEDAVYADLDTAEPDGIRVGETTISVAFSEIPEPTGLGYVVCSVLLAFTLLKRLKTSH